MFTETERKERGYELPARYRYDSTHRFADMSSSPVLPAPSGFEIRPVTADRWDVLEALFGPDGAFKGCWCAYWRLRHTDFKDASTGEKKRVLQDRVATCDPSPGLLAYRDNEPVGWVSVEPRHRFEAFEHARVYTRVDDTPVWTVSCFYLDESVRGRGLTTHLLKAVKVHVRANGGIAVEGYPENPTELNPSGTPGYMGLVPAFEHAGFVEIARLSNGRPVYRADLVQ